MPDVDREEAVRYIIDGLDPKPFRAIWDRLPQIVGNMIEYDRGDRARRRARPQRIR